MAALRVRPVTACLLATYAGLPERPVMPAMEPTLTMAPPRPWARSWRSSERMLRKTPAVLILTTLSKYSSEASWMGAKTSFFWRA